MKNSVTSDTQTIALKKSKPKLEAVLRIHGYKDLSKVRKTIRVLAEKAIHKFTEVSEPTVSYRVVDIHSVNSKSVILENDITLNSPIFETYLTDSTQAIAFALTVGKGIDDLTIEWMDKEMLVEALFLESAAWMGVEDSTKQFVLLVRAWAQEQNLRITRRLGPGYSYPLNGKQVQWDLTDQKPLFEILGENNVPITLLESAAMLPKMSRSGLYGLLPKSD